MAGPLTDLAGCRVLVTGASSGIGRALTLGLAAVGAKVAVHYGNNRRGGEDTVAAIAAAGGIAIPLQADFARPGAAGDLVERAGDRLGGLDVLINNAGGPVALTRIEAMGDTDFDHIFNLNARSVFTACRAAIPILRQRHAGARGASIINVTSQSARLGSSPGAAIYGASKAFVTALTKTLARELAPDGIRVNAISPGYIDTPLHHGLTPEELARQWASQIPLGRAGTASDCVGAALYLASDAMSSFVTGQVIEINGGQSMPG